MTKGKFVYVWEYIVEDAHRTEFEKVYGAEGDWVRLFQRAKGYITTDLHRDISNKNRFITVDTWQTKEDRDQFQRDFSREFESLDKQCERLTKRENWIGDFEQIPSFTERS